jgi:hypothetical protein
MATLTPRQTGMFYSLSASRVRGALAALFVLWLSTTTAHAQYRFDHWTADNGLPQNSVRDIVQTRDGYLWMTTFDGLVRFDGVRFTVFNKSNTPGLASNRFFNLFEDRSAPGIYGRHWKPDRWFGGMRVALPSTPSRRCGMILLLS